MQACTSVCLVERVHSLRENSKLHTHVMQQALILWCFVQFQPYSTSPCEEKNPNIMSVKGSNTSTFQLYIATYTTKGLQWLQAHTQLVCNNIGSDYKGWIRTKHQLSMQHLHFYTHNTEYHDSINWTLLMRSHNGFLACAVGKTGDWCPGYHTEQNCRTADSLTLLLARFLFQNTEHYYPTTS